VIVLGLDSRVVTAFVVGGGLLLFGLLLVITAAGELRGRRKARVPASMRPAPSDQELEQRVLTQYLAWGAAATMLMSLWLPLYWLREPTRLGEKEQLFVAQAVEQGEEIYGEFLCLTCHGEGGAGTTQLVTREGVKQQYAEPPLAFIYARYKAAGQNEEAITQLIYDAINRGRPGTPMPTWGAGFGGPLNTFQVDNLVEYIKSIQEPFPEPSETDGGALFRANCAVCHGPDADGLRNGEPTVGPNLTVALQRLSLDELRATIEHGRLNTNRPSMPAWAALGEEAIDALVQFVQSIQRS